MRMMQSPGVQGGRDSGNTEDGSAKCACAAASRATQRGGLDRADPMEMAQPLCQAHLGPQCQISGGCQSMANKLSVHFFGRSLSGGSLLKSSLTRVCSGL